MYRLENQQARSQRTKVEAKQKTTMSNHSNQAVKGGPSAPGSKKIMGSGATYRSKVQEASRKKSSTSPQGDKKSDNEEVVGSGSAPTTVPVNATAPDFGSGHYTPSKGE